MPDRTPREFRDALVDIGIFPKLVTAAIESIQFDVERMKAINDWEVMISAVRIYPYIDMIGAMFEKTPEQIDAAWMADPVTFLRLFYSKKTGLHLYESPWRKYGKTYLAIFIEGR